jgi:anthranilate phosphoribosyltransferase
VFAADLTDMMAHVLGALGSVSAIVVSGYGGLDELTTTGPNRISHFKDGRVNTYELDPLELGFRGASISELRGGAPPVNAAILRGILKGEIRDPKRDVVLLNAGAALLAAEKVGDIKEGAQLAADVIDSGAALAKLDALLSRSKSFAN